MVTAKRCGKRLLVAAALVCFQFAVSDALRAQDSVVRVQVPDGPSIEMVWVEGGTFTMGSNSGVSRKHKYDANRPEHRVSVGSYYIGRTEVTQALWKAVMGANPSQFVGDSLPVENITWAEAGQFAALLSQLTGRRFRLPTEAEWEYAARGGQRAKGAAYAGGQRAELERCAWYCVNSERKVHRVAQLQPNELGLYDMSGNVAEWCYDWFGPYGDQPQVEPRGPQSGDSRVLRGGHYNSVSAACTVYDRSWYEPAATSEYYGLRLVLEAEMSDE